MINYVYQLVSPKFLSIKYSDVDLSKNVIVRPRYMSICHADQRYYLGKRDASVLNEKLPMALIHECCGKVVCDRTGTFEVGQNVILIPNIPGKRKEEIFENYSDGAQFLSSGKDGFMREFVSISKDRLVPFFNIDEKIAAISEFVSVGIHAVNRFMLSGHKNNGTITVWGDGSLSYVICCLLKKKFKNSQIVVVGKNVRKLSQFSFVDKAYLCNNLPKDFKTDHAFECIGGDGSFYAINEIIRHIKSQGTLVLMGVSENLVPVNTRSILEKGLTLVGCSRSGKHDFEDAVSFMESKEIQKRLSAIIFEDFPVCNIKDIHRVFFTDLNTPFKTVFKWEI